MQAYGWTPPDESGAEILDAGYPAFWVCVHTAVLSKSNYRNNAKNTRSKSWPQLRSFSQTVSVMARKYRPSVWIAPQTGIALPLRPRAVASIVARTTLDTGNVSKSVLDAVEGIVVLNDAEFVSVSETVERSRTQPALLMAFAQLPANTPLPTCARACASLTNALFALQEHSHSS
jgi:Holliday junction resolvase RusA-like endonuclease